MSRIGHFLLQDLCENCFSSKISSGAVVNFRNGKINKHTELCASVRSFLFIAYKVVQIFSTVINKGWSGSEESLQKLHSSRPVCTIPRKIPSYIFGRCWRILSEELFWQIEISRKISYDKVTMVTNLFYSFIGREKR